MTTTQDKPALVYIHIFADGSKYFGNGVNAKRPWNFKKSRGPQYQAALDAHGIPIVQIRTNLTITEADLLEQALFDRYISQGGIALQRRPYGNDLQTAIMRSAKASYSDEWRANVSSATKGRKLSDEARRNMSLGQTGRRFSDEHRNKLSLAKLINPGQGNRKVISMIDGRVTTAAQAGHWNKKNPDYIGTWVDL
jgi:hypothetical protein